MSAKELFQSRDEAISEAERKLEEARDRYVKAGYRVERMRQTVERLKKGSGAA